MTNCLVFAVLLYRRRAGRRWYIMARWSDSGPFPHFLVRAGHHTISYKPTHAIDRTCPPPLFIGHVCWGD